MRNINAIQAVVLAIFMALLSIAFAADKPATQADFNELQKQVNTIDKELAVLKETKAGLEKRQTEITAGQANSLAAIANQTTMVGNYIALTSVLVTLLVFGAGSITYFSAVRKAKEEAQEASKKWFYENSVMLKKQISGLQVEATAASKTIQTQSTRVKADADVASETIAKILKQASANLFSPPTSSRDSRSNDDSNHEAVKTVRDASEASKETPQVTFSAADFYARGLADYADHDYQSALQAFKNAYQTLSSEASSLKKAQYLFAQGNALVGLDKSIQAIAIFDEIDQRFGAETEPAVRETIAKTLLNKTLAFDLLEKFDKATAAHDDLDRRFGSDPTLGMRQIVAIALQIRSFTQVLFAKERWTERAIREANLAIAEHAARRALLLCSNDARANLLGGLGYVQFLSGKLVDARITTQECIRLGGKKVLDVQLADAKLHRVEPQDSDYEKMLAEIWKSI